MSVEHFDVLVVGAGLSGIGAGYHLQTRCPGKRYAILEARDAIGGTWDLFRYPGIRSDSDMFTLGFSFRPWTDAKAIADGPAILNYVRETAREFGIDRHIRFNHRVISAVWSSGDACWAIEVDADGDVVRYTCDFLYLCSGYYRYESAYEPDFPGRERFHGTIVHPQFWPEQLEYRGKRVIVIGSGATAVTLVPAMAAETAHITMLQRSPSYIVSLPGKDRIADALRRLLPEHTAHRVARWKNVLRTLLFYQFCRRWPNAAKRLLRKGLEQALPRGYPIDTHFRPSYNPWDQRLCVVPDADLFAAIRDGRASVVTDRIETLTENGIRLQSGKELPADLIVAATGLQLVPCGGIRFEVDGQEIDLGQTFTYKGVMLTGMPNLAFCVGYTNASWTLRADLSSLFVCRLLNHMDRQGYVQCTPRNDDPAVQPRPLLDLSSGYVQRGVGIFPKQGSKQPWSQNQNYLLDLLHLKFGAVDDGALTFSRGYAASERPVRRSA